MTMYYFPSDNNEKMDDVPDFDPDDWVHPEVVQFEPEMLEVSAPHHGDGDDQMKKENLSNEQADAVIEKKSRLRFLRHAQEILKEVGGATGASPKDNYGESRHPSSEINYPR